MSRVISHISHLMKRALALLVLILCCSAAKSQSRADQLKAVFLYNFTQFTEWPSTAFHSSSANFIIGILGNDPFGSYLDSLVKGEKVGEHRIVVQRFSNAEAAKNCHLLFINVSNPGEVIRELENESILTIGNENNFTRVGGIIRFFTQSNKIRFQINLAAARAAKLSISSKLLRVADVINE